MKFLEQKLKEISIIRTGKLDSNAAVENGIFPFFTCDPRTLRIDNWAYDTEAVLLAGNNASGNYTAKYYKGKFNAYQRTYIIESSDKSRLNVRFLCYALNQKLTLLKTMSSGSTTKFITLAMLHNLEIPLPPLEIQEKIAGILSAYDDLIENNKKQIKLLEEAAQRLYKEWFVNFNFPGRENVKFIDGLPEGWRVGKLGEIIEYHDTKRKPLSGKQRAKIKGTYRYYGAAGILDYVNSYLFDGTYLLFGEDGTVINSKGNPILQYVTGKFWVNNHAHVLTGKNYSTEFIYMMFSSMIVSDIVTGVAQPKISQGRLNAKSIIIPKLEIAECYQHIIKPAFDKILILEKQIINLSEARDRLLPKLMSGEISDFQRS